MMDKDFLIQLTNKLYKLTLLFPKKEPLRYKMRELADDILANSLKSNRYEKQAVADFLYRLEILDGFFEVAKEQNWVKSEDLLNLQKEYSKLKEEFQKTQTEDEQGSTFVNLSRSNPPSPAKVLETNLGGQVARQEKILEILREKERAQVGDMKKIFSEVTKRTLRRDFRNLLKKGAIQRIGERNETFYRIKP